MIKRTIVLSQPAYLSRRANQLVIRRERNDEHSIPIEDVGIVILESHQCTITESLISALLANNAVIISCDERHHPDGMMYPLSGHVLHTAVLRDQINAGPALRKRLWKQTVICKVFNQASVLKRLKKPYAPLIMMRRRVVAGDTGNVESRAAAYYWKHVMPTSEFLRESDGEPPNNLLNYGYSIIRAAMARALVSSGLHPAIGIFHRNQYNAFCLADDCMEPYRPYVDFRVAELTSGGEMELTTIVKKKLLELLVGEVCIEGVRRPMDLAFASTAVSLAQCFGKQRKAILYPEYAV